MLDTDILSEVLKGVDPVVVGNAAEYRRLFGPFTVSTITVMEVVRGFQKNRGVRRLESFLAAIASEEILPFDAPAAELAGRISGDLERTGHPIGTADPMIAAIALRHGLELVTGNKSHFLRVANLGYPLTIGNWRS